MTPIALFRENWMNYDSRLFYFIHLTSSNSSDFLLIPKFKLLLQNIAEIRQYFVDLGVNDCKTDMMALRHRSSKSIIVVEKIVAVI